MTEPARKAISKKVPKNSAHQSAPAKQTVNGTAQAAPEEAPILVRVRAKVRGRVVIRLRVLDPRYTADKIVRLLNAGNAEWDVGASARYHRIKKDGKVIAEIEQADEDNHWGQYEPG